MSGGRFGYNQYLIEDIADEIEREIERDGDMIPSRVLDEFHNGVKALRKAAVYAQRIDWLLSGDDSPETFLERLAEDLEELRGHAKKNA